MLTQSLSFRGVGNRCEREHALQAYLKGKRRLGEHFSQRLQIITFVL
jgi:hypothetical protein